MRVTPNLLLFVGSVICFSVVGCASNFRNWEQSAVVVPAPSHPYLILMADRSTVTHGGFVEFTAKFVNPTSHKVAFPSETLCYNGEDVIGHRLEIDWHGESSNSTEVNNFGIDACPPSASYLKPKTSRSYRIKWKFKDRGRGTAELTFVFGSSDVFPPAKIILHTE